MDVSLQQGTVLKGKYRIGKVIGQGGFGITYEAVMVQYPMVKVAVKELFIREYMQRDPAESPKIKLCSEKDREVFERAKEDFLQEAFIIGMMNKEPAVVNVMEHFELHGTAYYVMEYVEGVNLGQYVKNSGAVADVDIFRRMLPIISTMKKLHEHKVLHCDISPDNIMVQEDGSLKLIDFGAAINYWGNQKMPHTAKEGYAPAEQYDRNEKTGPWTDVYALCATLYYCITGETPESAVDRVFMDEMKRPSGRGIRIHHELEEILWKGLEVDCENRYQSMGELEEEIRRILPRNRQTFPVGVKIAAAATLICMLAAGIAAAWKSYKEKNMFRGMETQKVVLIPDETMTVSDYVEARRIVEERIQIFSGSSPYRVEEDEEGKVHITTALSIFGEENADELYGMMISGTWNTELGKYAEESGEYLRCPVGNEDIVRAELKTGNDKDMSEQQAALLNPQEQRYIKLQFTQEKAEEIRRMFPGDYILYLYFNFDTSAILHHSVSASLSEDGRNCYLFGNFLQEERFGELLEYNLTHPSFAQAFEMSCEMAVDWESPDDSLLTGENQCRQDEIPYPAATVSYVQKEQYEGKMSKGEWAYILVTLKERLDALQVPYAIGAGKNDPRQIVLKMNTADVSAFYTDTVMENGYTAVIAGKWEEYDTPVSGKTTVAELRPRGDGSYQYVVQYDKDEWKRLERFTKEILADGKGELYLKIGTYYIAQCEIDAPVTDGRLIFDKMCDSGSSRITEKASRLFRYLNIFIQDRNSFAAYTPGDIVFIDESGEIDVKQELAEETYIQDFTAEFEKKVVKLYPQIRFKALDQTDSNEVCIELNLELAGDFVEQALETVRCIYEECDMKEGWLNNITFVLTQEREADSESARIYFGKQKSRVANDYYMNVLFQNGRMEWYKEELIKRIEEDDFFKKRLGTVNGIEVKAID